MESGRPRDATATHPLARGERGGGAAEGRRVRVTVVGGPDAGRTELIAQPTGIIGRAAGADVRLGDPAVSAFHLEVRATADGIHAEDLQSRNGTLYGSARVERIVLAPGAVLALGGSLVQLDLASPPEPAPAGEVLKFGGLRGRSPAMRALFAALARLSTTDLSVFIEGPTGVGKEVAARAVHEASAYASGPFVVLDCTAIPAALAESILLGHEGASDAAAARGGVFEAAHGGTLFLDQVGELPLEIQPKLLRVLERGEVVRVGGTTGRRVHVRVVCATWRDLRRMINQGTFREDLYYRLAQARVVIPPLRERPEDVAVLAHHVLQQRAPGGGVRAVAPDALAELARRDLPGNVRELRAILECAAIFASGPVITAADLAMAQMLSSERDRAHETSPSAAPGAPSRPSSPPRAGPPDEAREGAGVPLEPFKEARRSSLDEFERAYLERLLERTGSNLSRAASLAGIDRHYLRRLFRKHGLRTEG